MEKVRQIIREELRRALLEASEAGLYAQSEDEIIYNFEAGRTFGVNKLAKDINGLEHYYMSDYFPRSEMQEQWMFEIDNPYGGLQLVEIVHIVNEAGVSYWALNISEVAPGSQEPQITKSTGEIIGYRSFIDTVNSTLEKTINPDMI